MVTDEHGGGASTGTIGPYSSSRPSWLPRSLSTASPLSWRGLHSGKGREGDRLPPRMRNDAGAAGRAGATPLPPGAKMAAPFVWSVSR